MESLVRYVIVDDEVGHRRILREVLQQALRSTTGVDFECVAEYGEGESFISIFPT